MSTANKDRETPRIEAGSIEERLHERPGRFRFFAAVWLLEQIRRIRRDDASDAPPDEPPARFETPAATAFPATEIESLEAAGATRPPRMRVTFMGLTGPSGVLPRHYTTQLISLERRLRGAAKRALHAWYDLFSARFIHQHYKAWKRRRIDAGVASGAANELEPDRFTAALHSLAGVGDATLRDRLQVRDATDEWLLDRVNDQAIARHAAVLGRKRRPASQIASLLSDYFRVPVRVSQFQGDWLTLDEPDRTVVGVGGRAHHLGVDAVVGSRVWDVQSRVRICVGPLDRERFEQFLPDTAIGGGRRRFQCLCQLARLALGPEIEFDVQLILAADDVPRLRASARASRRLRWDAWLGAEPLGRNGDESVFKPIEATTLRG